MTTDHTREALIEWLEPNLPAVAGGDPDEDGMIWGRYDTARATVLADAVLASPRLAAHVAAVVESETASLRESAESALASGRTAVEDGRRLLALVEGKDAEIERLRQDLDEARAAVDVAVAAERERIGAAIEKYADAEAARTDWDGAPGLLGNWVNGIRDAARIARSTTSGGDTDG